MRSLAGPCGPSATKWAVVGVTLGFGLVGRADGALTLTLSEPGFAALTVTDAANTGTISYVGSYGTFQTSFTAGLSDRLTSSSTDATLQLQSLDVKSTSTAATPLTLTLSDDGYAFPAATGSTVSLDSAFGGSVTMGTAGDSVAFQSYVLSPATTTGAQTYTASVNDPGTTSFSRNVTPVAFIRPATYSLENVTTISLSGAGEQANLSGTTSVSTAVPEPTTAAVVGTLVLGGLGVRRRR